MARLVSTMATELEMHSDRVRAALRAIPSDIVLSLTDDMLNDLIRSIDAHSKGVYQSGFADGVKAGERSARQCQATRA